MGLKEAYYKIEDRWFALLDWLEAHHVNLYPVVDPLEKRGVPSLPVFIALFIIFIYILFMFILPAIAGVLGVTPPPPPDGGAGLLVNMVDENLLPLAGFDVKLFKQGETTPTEAAKSGTDGTAQFVTSTGIVRIEASKESCSTAERSVDAATQKNVTLNASCPGSVSFTSYKFCFKTLPPGKDPGVVSYKAYRGSVPFDRKACSDSSGNCTFAPQSGYSYKFEGSNGFESTVALDAGTLVSRSQQGTTGCIELKEKPKPDIDAGKVVVVVSQVDGTLVPGVKVELVNPQDINSLVLPDASKPTGQTGSYLGKAVFDGLPVGTLFSIVVRAGSNTSFFHDNRTFNVTRLGLTVNVTIDLSTPTYLSVREVSGGVQHPLSGVVVTLFDKLNQKVGAKVTNSNGDAVIGLTRNERYRAAFFLKGYVYKEETVLGGENRTVILESVAPEELASLDAYVLFKGSNQPVTDATLNLKRKDNATGQWVLTGYPPQLADEDGHALFEGLTPATVCVQPSRPAGKALECVQKVVSAGDNELIISIDPNKFSLKVWVYQKSEDGTLNGVEKAKVTVSDWETGAKLEEGSTFPDGHYTFSIGEDKTVRVDVDYKDSFGEYPMTAGPYSMSLGHQTVNFTLVALSNEVTFGGITGFSFADLFRGLAGAGSSELGSPQDPLMINMPYRAVFYVGLKDIRNEMWDKVTFSLAEAGSLVDFYPPESSDFEFSALPGSSLTATLEGKYDSLRNKVVRIEIPFAVKPIFSGAKDTTIKFSSKWEKGSGSLRDPESGDKTQTLSLISLNCEKTSDGKWGYCTEVVTKDGTHQKPSRAHVNLNEQATLNLILTYLGSEADGFGGKVLITDRDLDAQFLKNDPATSAYKAIPDNSSPFGSIDPLPQGTRFTITDHAIIINLGGDLPSGNPAALRHGESLSLSVAAKAISPTDAAQVAVELQPPAATTKTLLTFFNFWVVGDGEAEIRYTPAKLFDLTPELVVKLFEKANNKQIKTIASGTVNGDGISCRPPISFTSIIDAGAEGAHVTYEGTDAQTDVLAYKIGFDESCRLQSGGKVKVSAQPEHFRPAETEDIPVSACITTPAVSELPRLFIKARQKCRLDFKFNSETGGYTAFECGSGETAGTGGTQSTAQPVVFNVLKDEACTNVQNALSIKDVRFECENDVLCPTLLQSTKEVTQASGNNPASVKFNYPRTVESTKNGAVTVTFEVSATTRQGSPPLKKQYSVRVPFQIGIPIEEVIGGTTFKAFDIPKKFRDPDGGEDWCSEAGSATRFCTIEQAIWYSYYLTNGFNSGETEALARVEKMVRLVTMSGLTSSDVRDIAAKLFGPEGKVIYNVPPALTVAATAMTKEEFLGKVERGEVAPGRWLVIDSSNAPEIGRNNMVIESGSNGDRTLTYSIVSFTPVYSPGLIDLITTSRGVQLFMPAISSDLRSLSDDAPAISAAVMGRIETQAIGKAEALTDDAKSKLRSVLENMYGDQVGWDIGDAKYAQTGEGDALRLNKIVLEICDNPQSNREACDNFDHYTGGFEGRNAVIFLDENWRVHFNAPTQADLGRITGDFAVTIGGGGQPFEFVEVPNQPGYLREKPTAEAYFLAVKKEGAAWNDITQNQQFMGGLSGGGGFERIQKTAGALSGIQYSKIDLLPLTTQDRFNRFLPPYMFMIVVTPTAADAIPGTFPCSLKTTAGGELLSICNAFNERWNRDQTPPYRLDVPEGGIFWVGNPGDNYYYIYSRTIDEAISIMDAIIAGSQQGG
ncbi:hypothetical protein HYS54_03585 [Candidatus Micrarchaeota archaeon]|nr:hypothetical protein [Candidatus Micrarchaeota archaeon]